MNGQGRAGPSDADLHKFLGSKVSMLVRYLIPKMFRRIKIDLIAMFDERYTATIGVSQPSHNTMTLLLPSLPGLRAERT